MPSIRNQSTIDLIAEKFCGEAKRVQVEALILCEYSPKYAYGRGHEVFENVCVKAAIAKIDADNKAKNEVNAEFITKKLLEEITNLPLGHTSRQQALEKLAKHINYYKLDNESIRDQPATLTPEQLAELKKMAVNASNIRLMENTG